MLGSENSEFRVFCIILSGGGGGGGVTSIDWDTGCAIF